MAPKIIQDIYVVKKSIRMIKKSDVRDGFYASEKKSSVEEKKEKEKEKEKETVSDFVHKLNSKRVKEEEETEEVYEPEDNLDTEEDKHVTKSSLMFLWIICIIAVATLLFFLSSIFSTATISITPRSEKVSLNDTYNITADKAISSTTLHYELMTINKELSKTLETDGEEYVEKKATGKAILYNNFSTVSQRLINNTRLETKSGLTYRIRESVEIPGIKTVAGVKTPGSIEVDIIADMPGDKYNMEIEDLKGDFSIPGFKGSTKYTTFYGRLSSDVTGGFIGNMKKVSEEKLTSARAEIKESLNTDLIKEVFAKKPEQYVLFKDNYYITCKDLSDSSAGSEYKISTECSINAILFNKEILAQFIAKNKLKDFDNSKVDAMWTDENTVTLTSNTEKPWNETFIKAKFSGPVNIVWSYDSNFIVSGIAGYDKSIINSVIENNKNYVSEITATIRPMWKNTFPENPKKIKIVDTVRDSAI